MPDWLCHHCATNSLQATLNFSISFTLGGQVKCSHLFIAADNFDQRGENDERYFKKKNQTINQANFLIKQTFILILNQKTKVISYQLYQTNPLGLNLNQKMSARQERKPQLSKY